MKKISEIRMNPKRYLVLLLVVFSGLAIAAAVTVAVRSSRYKKEIQELEIINPDFSKLQDGEYTGSCNLRIVKAWVRVAVQKGKVVRIQLVHDDSKGDKAEGLTDLVIEKQSLEIDTVSGATYSSKAILKAVENALRKSEAGNNLPQRRRDAEEERKGLQD